MVTHDAGKVDQTIGLKFTISVLKHLKKIQEDLSKSLEWTNTAMNGLIIELERERNHALKELEAITQHLSGTHSASEEKND